MRRSVANDLGLELLNCPEIVLKSFSGAITDTVSQETQLISFSLGSLTFKSQFLICDHLSSEIILGFQFLKDNNLLVDCRSSQLVPREAWVRFKFNSRSSVSTHLNSITQDDFKLPSFLKGFESVFDISRCQQLPPYDPAKAMDIELVADATPLTSSPIYKLSLKEELALRQEIDEGLKSGKIVPRPLLPLAPFYLLKKATVPLDFVLITGA